jgi:hypothetical protein
MFLEPQDGLKAIDEILQTVRDSASTNSPYQTCMPLVVRYVAADEMWLSQQYGRPSLVISVSQYRSPVEMDRYSRMVEAIAIKHGARPHWGKSTRCIAPAPAPPSAQPPSRTSLRVCDLVGSLTCWGRGLVEAVPQMERLFGAAPADGSKWRLCQCLCAARARRTAQGQGRGGGPHQVTDESLFAFILSFEVVFVIVFRLGPLFEWFTT